MFKHMQYNILGQTTCVQYITKQPPRKYLSSERSVLIINQQFIFNSQIFLLTFFKFQTRNILFMSEIQLCFLGSMQTEIKRQHKACILYIHIHIPLCLIHCLQSPGSDCRGLSFTYIWQIRHIRRKYQSSRTAASLP